MIEQNYYFYHGTSIKGLQELQPHLSNHHKEYVYLTSNIVVATFYTVKSYLYTYGFNQDKIPIFTEYYKGQLKEMYEGRKGYIYQSLNGNFMQNPTNIWCAVVATEDVKVKYIEEIIDVYEKLLEYEKKSMLIIRRYYELTEENKQQISKIIINEIIENNLLNNKSEYGNLLKIKFKNEWKKAKNIQDKK